MACILLYMIGFGECYVRTGNTIALQTKTAEYLRSRVLGNSFMLSRAVGALSVALTGILIDFTNFTLGMSVVAVIASLFILSGLMHTTFRTQN